MPSNIIGVRNNNVIVPYSAATKRTKELDISAAVTSSAGTVSTKAFRAIFYADSLGNWRVICSGSLAYSGNVDLSGASDKYLTFAGLSFVNSSSDLAALNSAFAAQVAQAEVNSSGRLGFLTASTTIQYLRIFFDAKLAAEPTWASLGTTAAAAMEGVTAVDVYIPPVSDGITGLFPALNTSLDNATATRLGLKQYLHGTNYNGGNAPTVTLASGGGTLSSIPRAVFVPYQCQDGSWRLRFNITAVLSSATRISAVLNVNGMVAKNVTKYNQAFYSFNGQSIIHIAGYTSGNTGDLTMQHASSVTVEYFLSGDIELESKPSWAY